MAMFERGAGGGKSKKKKKNGYQQTEAATEKDILSTF